MEYSECPSADIANENSNIGFEFRPGSLDTLIERMLNVEKNPIGYGICYVDGDSPKIEFLRSVYKLIVRNNGAQILQKELSISLNVTPRTLRRRLKEMGTTYKTMQADVRKLISEQLVGESIQPITEIALLIGFSDTSAFTKAFKTWFGVCPTQYRRTITTLDDELVDKNLESSMPLANC